MRTRWLLPLTLLAGCSFIDDFDKFRERAGDPEDDGGAEAGEPDAAEPDEDGGSGDAARVDAGDSGRDDAGDEPGPMDAGGDARPPDRDAAPDARGGEDAGADAFVPDACGAGPFPAEVCDGRDNDCDGTIDDGFELKACYPDRDEDGFADVSVAPVMACECPDGLIEVIDLDSTRNDCFDDPERDGEDVFPGQPEFFEDGYGNGRNESFDYDCDGVETPEHGALPAVGCAGLLGTALLCSETQGYTPAPPACGDSGEFVICIEGTLCGSSSESRKQSCR